MFEDYLQDSYEFLALADASADDGSDREARRYYRASAFYASGAIEAFVNHIAECFAQAGNISPHEIAFLKDKALVFSAAKGLYERSEYHRLDDKIRLVMKRFVPSFEYQGVTWVKFMEFKDFRDSLVHPRGQEDETGVAEYRNKLQSGLRSIIEIMDEIARGMFGTPLRKQLLDLIPD
jgi:hypothetical protein